MRRREGTVERTTIYTVHLIDFIHENKNAKQTRDKLYIYTQQADEHFSLGEGKASGTLQMYIINDSNSDSYLQR